MATPVPDQRVAAVVALKPLSVAKSRMSSLPDPVRERLVLAMALDTIAALVAVADQTLVISDQPGLAQSLQRHGLAAQVIPDPDGPDRTGPGAAESLNQALAHGDRLLRAAGADVVLACVADLPALLARSARRVLAAATSPTAGPRSFVADADDRGTTLLVARSGALDPRYGSEIVDGQLVGSAERHRRTGATPLTLDRLDDARRDVDTVADLVLAGSIGVGPATGSLLEPTTHTVGRYHRIEVVETDHSKITVVSDGSPESVAWEAYDGDPALLVPGRRLHAVRVGSALRCWP